MKIEFCQKYCPYKNNDPKEYLEPCLNCPVDAFLYWFAEKYRKNQQGLLNMARCHDAFKQNDGSCLGYQRTMFDDEPVDACKECDRFSLNQSESEGIQ